MGIFSRILGAFAKPGANLSEESRTFIASIANAEIWILAIGVRGTPTLPRNLDAVLEVVADHRIDVSEIGESDSVVPFNYEEAGRQLLPFFTTEERAKSYITTINSSLSGIFQPYPMLAGFVTDPGQGDCDPILDPKSPGERRLSPEECRLMRALAVGNQGNAG